MGMKKDDAIEALITFIGLMTIVCVFLLILITFKYRDLMDKYAELEIKCKRLENRSVYVVTEYPTHVEPSDDEIVISVGGD